jgi:hypothetical protein
MSEIFALVGFLGLVALLVPRLWREQHSHDNRDPHSVSRVSPMSGPKAGGAHHTSNPT